MSDAAHARFTFDLDLGRRDERSRLLSEPALTKLLNDARLEGYAQGLSDGKTGVESNAAQVVAAAAATLADRAGAMTAQLEAAKAQIRTDAAHLARDVARKLALHLIARQPAAELMALFEECLASLEDVPHLVIRCHPDLADRIRVDAEARIAGAGFSGRLVVIGDPELAISDGRIEWADGGLKRNLAAISEAIDAAIATYLQSHGVHP